MAEEQDTKKKPKAPKKVALKVSAVRTVAAEDREADKESLGQVRKTMVFLFGVAVVYAVYLVVTGQVDEFLTSLAGVDLSWIAAGVACFLLYYVFGILAYVLSVASDPDCPVGIRDLMSVEASGVFFMRLTPNSAGAPPAQIFRLTRAGMSAGAASALNFTRTIIYEAGEGVFAAIMLLFCGSYFYDTFGDVTLIGLFLFGFKVVQVGGMIVLCLLPKQIMAIGNWALRFANRHGWIKDEKYEKYYDVINTQVMEFSRAFKRAAANVPEMLATMGVTLLQLGCMYALPYFVLRSFGEPADFLICLASGSMVELLVNAVPLPGGAGGAEVGFAYLFRDMFGSHLSAGFVIWRAVEYLLPVIIAAPCMGLRSTSGESINRRASRAWRRVRNFLGGRGSGGKGSGGARGGVTVRPGTKRVVVAGDGGARKAASSDVEARIAAGKAAAAAKRVAGEKDGAAGGAGGVVGAAVKMDTAAKTGGAEAAARTDTVVKPEKSAEAKTGSAGE